MSTWTTPVIDRVLGARMTYEDMNRITNNLNYLTDELTAIAMYHGEAISKLVWVRNDYVTLLEWRNILAVLAAVMQSLGLTSHEQATEQTTHQNINTVEDLTLRSYERLQRILNQGAANKYVDTEIYAGEGYRAGGVEQA